MIDQYVLVPGTHIRENGFRIFSGHCFLLSTILISKFTYNSSKNL